MTLRGACALVAAVAMLAVGAGAAEAKRPLFGVVPQDGALPAAGDLELMPSGGISETRLLLHWGSIERQPGSYDWSAADAIVGEATKHGIKPLFFLFGTPDWAARRVVNRAHDANAGTWVTEIGWAASGPRKNPYVKGERGPGAGARAGAFEADSKAAHLSP